MHGIEPARAFDGAGGGEWGNHYVGLEEPCGKRAKDVAIDLVARLIDDQRPVTIAIGGNHRIKPVLGQRLPRQLEVLGLERLGIDSDKGLTAPKPGDRCAEPFEIFDEQITSHGGMLKDADVQASQSVSGEGAEIAFEIVLDGIGLSQRQMGFFGIGRRCRALNAQRSNEQFDGTLIPFSEFALGTIELEAIIIGGNGCR